MATIRCGYCGRYYDDGYTGALDNGFPIGWDAFFCMEAA